MSMSDPIADMFTRIRNAQVARHADVSMPFSKKKVAIIELLKEQGFIAGYQVQSEEGNKPTLTIELKYFNNKRVIEMLERVSKPGLRVYTSAKEMPVIMDNLGVVIVSTSKGVMTGRQAKAAGMGGEILGYVA